MNLETLAADIVRRIPAMAIDAPENNYALVLPLIRAEISTSKVALLADDVRQDSPMAYMVFCHKDIDHDYLIFPEYHEAQTYAMEQEEKADAPEGSWQIYPLQAVKI